MFALLRYLKFLARSGNAHGLHSPFVFSLYTEIIDSARHYYAFDEIEELRLRLLQGQAQVQVQDLGTGNSGPRSVAELAQRASATPKVGQLLFRLVNHFQPRTVLELGTCLGLGTLYLAKARPEAELVTLEGSQALADLAEEHFRACKVPVRVVRGDLAQTLGPTLASLPSLDFAFLDANHRYEATMQYFGQCLAHTHAGSVLVLDDIHWSAEMERAWAEVQAHPAVTLTVDLFRLGLVFFRTHQPKQHFRLRF
jgi:predicted O-methyltransferase YrrM